MKRLFAFSIVVLWTSHAVAQTGSIAVVFDGWAKPSEANYTAAQQQYEQFQTKDARLSYAMALVAIKNHRLGDASKYLNDSPRSGDWLVPAQRLKIWLNATKGDTKSVQSELKQLAGAPGDRETVEWMGRVLGFYAATGNIPPSNLAALETELTAKLPPSMAESLVSGKTNAAKTFADLQKEQADTRSTIKAKLSQKLEQDRKQNETALADATQKREAAEQALAQFRTQAEKDSASAEKALGKLEANAERQEGRMHNQQTRIVRSANRLANGHLANPNGHEEKRIVAKEKLEADVETAQNIIASGSQASDKLQTLQANAKRYENLERGLTAKKQQLEKPLADNPATAVDAKIASIGTYAGIDLDAEKDKLLQAAGKR